MSSAKRTRQTGNCIMLCLGYDPHRPRRLREDRVLGPLLCVGKSRFALDLLEDDCGFAISTDVMSKEDVQVFEQVADLGWKTRFASRHRSFAEGPPKNPCKREKSRFARSVMGKPVSSQQVSPSGDREHRYGT